MEQNKGAMSSRPTRALNQTQEGRKDVEAMGIVEAI